MKIYDLWDSANGQIGFYTTAEKAYKELKKYFDYLVEDGEIMDNLEDFKGCGYYSDDNFNIEEFELDKEIKL